jgi:hypothetical protein
METDKATLIDVLPPEFRHEYTDTRAWAMRHVAVLKEFHSRSRRWIGPHKNVYVWYVLENGYAVAWNENIARGWSFPVQKLPKGFVL